MALDHYISQVHLKNFYNESEDPPLNAICKTTMKQYKCHARDICRISEGSTNNYLTEPRYIEEFLRVIEQNYNLAIYELENNYIGRELIYIIAGWVAFVSTCSPAAMRIQSIPIKESLRDYAKILDDNRELEKPPQSLNANSFTECIDQGKVIIDIDKKFPQAIGMKNILDLTYILGNSKWEALINAHEDSLFFTSDYPIIVERQPNSLLSNTIIPLSPKVALRIHPNIHMLNEEDFSAHKFRKNQITRKQAQNINRLIVRCAEENVFFTEHQPWVFNFVEKNSNYHVGIETSRSNYTKGAFTMHNKVICRRI